MNDQHMRFNQITGRWVFYAPSRGERPHDHEQPESTTRAERAYDPACPFCPGNEDQLSEIRVQHPDAAGEGWQTRIVPNKYAVVMASASTERQVEGMFIAAPVCGQHEVIIETPQHDGDLATMDHPAIETVIETYHRRYAVLMQRSDTRQVILFRNHGEGAGTSLRHPHAQIVATSIVAQRTRQYGDLAERYHHQYGGDLVGDLTAQEEKAGRRLVAQNGSYVAFVPFAAEVPYEMWISPRVQQADFSQATTAQRRDLAHLLRDLLSRLRGNLDDPDYNLILESAPQHEIDAPYLRWYMRIRPRMITRAGFELGSGIRVNPTLPEDNAAAINAG